MLNDRIWKSGSGVITIPDGDTTPDISGGRTFETSNSASTTITDFDNGIGDKVITIIAGDNNTTIACNANVILEGGSDDFDMVTNDVLRLSLQSDGTWVQKGRSMNSQKLVLNFDSQYDAEAANSSVNDIAGEDFAVSFWIRTSGLGSDTLVYAKSGGNLYHLCYLKYDISAHRNCIALLLADYGTSKFFTLESNAYVDDNTWHHIAYCVDRDQPDNDHCKLYQDGVDVGVVANNDTFPTLSNAGIFHLGSFGGMMYLPAKLCDFKFLKGGLWTQEQVVYQYEHPWDYSASAGGITEYWRCDEGEGLTLNGSNEHDLTLSNAAAWKGKWPDV